MIDLHVHTGRCRHAQGTVAEYVSAARDAGVDIIAMTDHLPLPPDLLAADAAAASYAMPASELGEYVLEVTRAREASRDAGGPEVLLGIEADLHPGNEEYVRSLLGAHPFDVVLGSVHFVDGWAFDDPDRKDGYSAWDIGELWRRYFDDLSRAAQGGLADVIAHADLVKKFNFVPAGDLGPLYRDAARAFSESGVVVEVNTAGLRKDCAELYPSGGFLTELARAGVRVTIGSDAHRPADVGWGYQAAREALMRVGYDSVVVFRRRVPEEVPL